jgi:hypothetical protein
MDLIVEPDIYSPNIDNDGNYVDKSPSYIHFKNGIRCPCGTRKDKIYECNSYFSNHIKTKTHQKWLFDLNTNKTNYYTENIMLKDTINNQKIIIARLEKDKIVKSKTIDILTQQLINKEAIIVTDLLVFD